jgi:hypothetical protein
MGSIELLFGFDSRFQGRNYPPGKDVKPDSTCPNYQLIDLCSKFAGTEINPSEYCGHRVVNPVYSEGFIHNLESADLLPKTACTMCNWLLRGQLDFVKKDIQKPDEQEIETNLDQTRGLEAKKKILEKFSKQNEAWNQRSEILNRWRNVVFENCVCSTEDEPNQHFRQFTGASELAEGEIISTVEKYTKKLEEITEYRGRNIISGDGGAKNCPQSPHLDHFGPLID